jgi:hypothetical protein
MDELRSRKRRHLIYYLDVLEAGTGKTLGKLGDVTEKGLLLLSEAPLEKATTVQLKLVLPKAPGFEGDSFAATARVQWCNRDQNPALYCSGLEFQDLGPREQAVVDLLVKLVGFNDA